MCQILGMNCASPTDFSFSLKGFCQRGGNTDIHSHGFGICIYEGRGVRSFHDTLPACQSPIAQLVQTYPIRTYNMMAHIRFATEGGVSLENVHPFVRVWKGIQLTFCHNGECPTFCNHAMINLARTQPQHCHYHPVGDTDSEHVFCSILNALTAEFPDGSLPTLDALHCFLLALCREIIASDPLTIFNFLLGVGPYTQFAYSWPGKRPGSKVWNGLHYIVRQPPFSTARLVDVDYSIDFSTVTTAQDRIAVITTKPLTQEEGWTEFQPGELIMFDRGTPCRTPQRCRAVEQEGRGLYSTAFCERNRNKNEKMRKTCSSSEKPCHGSSPCSILTENSPPDVVEMADPLATKPRSICSGSTSPRAVKSVLAATAAAVEAEMVHRAAR